MLFAIFDTLVNIITCHLIDSGLLIERVLMYHDDNILGKAGPKLTVLIVENYKRSDNLQTRTFCTQTGWINIEFPSYSNLKFVAGTCTEHL